MHAEFRTPDELATWARVSADEALLERTMRGLHTHVSGSASSD